MVKILHNVKIKIVILFLHRGLFCTGMDLDDIMYIDCLASTFLVFYRFSLVCYKIKYCVTYENRGTPPPPPQKKKYNNNNHPNLHLSEIRIFEIDL